MKISHPIETAREMAHWLDSDPVAASQVSEHLTSERLQELLQLPPCEPTAEDLMSALKRGDINRLDLSEVLDCLGHEELLEEVTDRFTQAQVLRAFRVK